MLGRIKGKLDHAVVPAKHKTVSRLCIYAMCSTCWQKAYLCSHLLQQKYSVTNMFKQMPVSNKICFFSQMQW